MDEADMQRIRNDNARLFTHGSRITVNSVRFNIGNSLEHEIAKFLLCWEMKQFGYHFITEAVYRGINRRVDIINLDTGEIIEIETGARAIRKKCKGNGVAYVAPEGVIRRIGGRLYDFQKKEEHPPKEGKKEE